MAELPPLLKPIPIALQIKRIALLHRKEIRTLWDKNDDDGDAVFELSELIDVDGLWVGIAKL